MSYLKKKIYLRYVNLINSYRQLFVFEETVQLNAAKL